ncbi:MAG: hypothetical protein M1830_006969 [Pleopsidium flavum]|nr:MAG: hypothetical protein M1830_006969 [Pleopsidium flavum]
MSTSLWIIIILVLLFGLKFNITIRWGQPQPAREPVAEAEAEAGNRTGANEVEGEEALPVHEPRREEDGVGEGKDGERGLGEAKAGVLRGWVER